MVREARDMLVKNSDAELKSYRRRIAIKKRQLKEIEQMYREVKNKLAPWIAEIEKQTRTLTP